MRGIDELLREHPFFAGLDDDALALIAGCAANRHMHAGEYLYREGDPADDVLRDPAWPGRARGAPAGRRGRRHRDRRGRRGARLVVADPAAPLALRRPRRRGHERGRLRRHLPARQVRRRPGPRVRPPAAGGPGDATRGCRRPGSGCSTSTGCPVPPAVDPMLPRPFRVVGAPAGHRRHRDARPSSRSTARRSPSPPGSSRCSGCSGSARCRSRSAATRAAPCCCTRSATSGGSRTPWSRPRWATCWRCAGRTGPAGASSRAGAATSSSWPAASGWRRCGRRSSRLLAERERYGRVALLYGARSPADQLYPDELVRWRDHGIDVDTIVDHGAAGWPGRVGLVTALGAGHPRRPGPHAGPGLRPRGDDALRRPGADRPGRRA